MNNYDFILEVLENILRMVQEPSLHLIMASGVLISVLIMSIINNLSPRRAAQITILLGLFALFSAGGRQYLSNQGVILVVSLAQTYALSLIVWFSFSVGFWLATFVKIWLGTPIATILRSVAIWLLVRAESYSPTPNTSKLKERITELDTRLAASAEVK